MNISKVRENLYSQNTLEFSLYIILSLNKDEKLSNQYIFYQCIYSAEKLKVSLLVFFFLFYKLIWICGR